MLFYRPVNYIGVSRRRLRGLDSKTDTCNLCNREFRSRMDFVARWKNNVRVSQAPDLALRQSLHTKDRSFMVSAGRVAGYCWSTWFTVMSLVRAVVMSCPSRRRPAASGKNDLDPNES